MPAHPSTRPADGTEPSAATPPVSGLLAGLPEAGALAGLPEPGALTGLPEPGALTGLPQPAGLDVGPAHAGLTGGVPAEPARAGAESESGGASPAGNRRDRRKRGAVDPQSVAGDERLAARQRSQREHANRAGGVGKGRSYAFRRS